MLIKKIPLGIKASYTQLIKCCNRNFISIKKSIEKHALLRIFLVSLVAVILFNIDILEIHKEAQKRSMDTYNLVSMPLYQKTKKISNTQQRTVVYHRSP